jgi:hypothetical protein
LNGLVSAVEEFARGTRPARFAGGAQKASAYMCGSEAADWMANRWFVDIREGRRPWQDRQTLAGSAASALRRQRLAVLLMAFASFAKTMKDNRNVQHSSCAT